MGLTVDILVTEESNHPSNRRATIAGPFQSQLKVIDRCSSTERRRTTDVSRETRKEKSVALARNTSAALGIT